MLLFEELAFVASHAASSDRCTATQKPIIKVLEEGIIPRRTTANIVQSDVTTVANVQSDDTTAANVVQSDDIVSRFSSVYLYKQNEAFKPEKSVTSRTWPPSKRIYNKLFCHESFSSANAAISLIMLK